MSQEQEPNIDQEETIQYQGRKASRAKSEHRRLEILEAALRIVRTEGVRGIRHRAVAKEAGVPLAATTYYFRDIEELIVDAFTLYTEQALAVLNEFTQHFYQPLAEVLGRQDNRTEEGKQRLINYMTEQVHGYMINQVDDQRDMLIVEQALRYEAIINPSVRVLLKMHRKALYDIAIEFFTHLIHSETPYEDAELLIGLFHTLEYNSLLEDLDNLDSAQIERSIRHYVTLLVTFLLR